MTTQTVEILKEIFSEEELKHIQQALKFYYEDWNGYKGEVYPTSVLSDETKSMVIKSRLVFLDAWKQKQS